MGEEKCREDLGWAHAFVPSSPFEPHHQARGLQYRVPGFLATSLSKAKAEEFAERAFDEGEGKMPVVLWTIKAIDIQTRRHTVTVTVTQ